MPIETKRVGDVVIVGRGKQETLYAVERRGRRGWVDLGRWFRTKRRAEAYIAEWKDPERMRVVLHEVGPSVGGFTVRL